MINIVQVVVIYICLLDMIVHNRSSILNINYYIYYDDGLLLFDNTDDLYARSVVILRWEHSVWA
jgi:hypothetical protein